MKYCLSTVVYPGVEPFFQDFLEAFYNLAEPVDLIVFNHDSNVQCENFRCFDLPASCSIAQVRSRMFSYLKENTNYGVYLFTDSDDRIFQKAIAHHEKALQAADFSYGDQRLFKGDFDHPLDGTLFSRMQPPEFLKSSDDLLRGNCVGGSALALSRKALLSVPDIFPEGFRPLDWWLALKLLGAGMVGAKADVVTDYRLSANAGGMIEGSKDLNEFTDRLEAVKSLCADIGNSDLKKLLNRLENLTNEDAVCIKRAIKEVSKKNMMWYQDVFEVLDMIEERKTRESHL